MLTVVTAKTGHGNSIYTLKKAVEKSHNKKLLIISYELTTDLITSRLSAIFKFYDKISPAEIKIISYISLSNMDILDEFDVVSILGYTPTNNMQSKISFGTAMKSFVYILRCYGDRNKEKDIFVTMQVNGSIKESFSEIQDSFFNEKKYDEVFLGNDNFNKHLIYKDIESKVFKVLDFNNKSVTEINRDDFFCNL